MFSKKSLNAGNDWFYLVARLLVGFMMAVHGAQKFGLFGGPGLEKFSAGVGVPLVLAVLQGLLELFAGLFVAFGLWVRVGAVFGVVSMIAALVVAHFPKGWNPFTSGAEKPLLYIAAFLLFYIFGSRKYGVDFFLKK